MRSSDPSALVTVVEGMPGAGKTTVLSALARAGRTVLPEYTTPAGDLLDHDRHPRHDDEDSHLANWLRKADHLRGRSGPVWVDRDWLTALAWAASTSGLTERADWAYRHLTTGRLIPPHRWIILDLPPHISLQRRAQRLHPGHPWSDPAVLERLRTFYLDPPTHLATAHPGLTELVAAIPRQRVDAIASTAQLASAVDAVGAR
ncbi:MULTISPECIES: AAA family ATPase [Streptacidiphilus]|uniref:AAA family ATPase n=1 Tax=Streptacidiphilus cavernicola TaxID=3342716 RepID=A0ABV6UNX8_9ACTN|nr:AAA family ATPase [Streptacidiphilus jeojiense]